MIRKPDTERQVMQRIDELCHDIETYLDSFRRKCPFSSEQLMLHVKTINLRFRLGSVDAALESDDFIRYLWLTLRAWGLNARGTRLLPLEDFKQTLIDHRDHISELDGVKIDDADLPVRSIALKLWRLVDEIRVSKAGNPVVSGSKTLHHLLPELVLPIDRKYTRRFFKFWMSYFQYNPERVFIYIWEKAALIAHKINLRRYIGWTKWCTSITKVLDNAIVGYCIKHRLPRLH